MNAGLKAGARRLASLAVLAALNGLIGLMALPGSALAAPATGPTDRQPVLQPLAARYRVSISLQSADGRRRTHQTDWYFYRGADRIALVKGEVEDIWTRDAGGSIHFERVLHADRRVIDYSAGELATLGLAPDWAALSGFLDLGGITALQPSGRPGPAGTLHYSGSMGTAGSRERIEVEWLPALGLPGRLLRQAADGSQTRHQLVSSAAQPGPGWPLPGARSGDYLHIDAADFGDMAYDPVVRRAEALDVRAGWRVAHGHD